ncbi:MAG: FKBP-type peptidyl-prolyl cis-trans isomerase [Marinifilaceae bacterium]
MKIKNLLLTLAVGATAASCCDNGAVNSTKATLKTSADTASYYIGYLYGTGLQRTGIDEPNMGALVAGMNCALQNVETKEDPQQMEMFLNQYIQNLMTQKADVNLKKGQEFLEANAKKDGVEVIEDGIQYKVIQEGTGAKPTETDVVKVHYTGTLLNGEKFDSSVDRGEPAEFQLNRVIPGWTKALQQMPVGSKWVIYIPADQAYGQRGGGPIGPNETLIFEVELLEIVNPDGE